MNRDAWLSRKNPGVKVQLTCKRLSSILEEHSVRRVDFMSLDLEGFEEYALRGVDFSRHSIDVIMMEGEWRSMANASEDGNRVQRAARLLRSAGFELVRGLGFRPTPIDSLWVHRHSIWWTKCTWAGEGMRRIPHCRFGG